MRGRLLTLAAAAACILAAPSMEARASAAATVPALKSDSSAVTQVQQRRVHRGGHFRGHRAYRPRSAFRHSYRPRAAHGYRRAYRPRHVYRHHRYHRRYRGPRFAVYGIPRYYGYGYRRGCGWLHRRAINTGSRYWWRRYQACRRGW